MTRRMGMKRVAVGITMMLVLFFCISLTVRAFDKKGRGFNQKVYDRLEAEYEQEIREILDAAGHTRAGLMMTHVDCLGENGWTRTYYVNVYDTHLTEEAVIESVRAVRFGDFDCEVFVEINL